MRLTFIYPTMIIVMIIATAIISIVIEYYILRSLPRTTPRWIKVCYIAQAAIISLGTASVMSFYKSMMIDPSFMGISLWVVFIFLISLGIKAIIALSLFIRFVLHKIWKRHSFKGVVWFGGAVAVLVVSLFAYGSTYGRTEIRIERVEIRSSKIPASFDGMRIAQFSDTHIGNYGGSTSVIEDLVEAINNEAPDIVIQSGDLVNIHSDELTDDFMEVFAEIQAPVYAVLGNHDLAYYIGDTTKIKPSQSINNLRTKQRSMGWRLMENEGEWLRRGSDSIMLAGVTFPRNHSHNGYNSVIGKSDMPTALQGVTTNDYSILIAHSPSLFDSLSHTGILPDLVISGHVHSMQMKIKCGDWQWSPAKWMYPMFSGLYDDRGRKLYVNDGIGYVLYPVRLGTRPELTIFTLRSDK